MGRDLMAVPKLGIQFLTMHDYLLRNFNLFRLESSYEIRQDIENAVLHLAPTCTSSGLTEFTGWARMAVEILNFKMVHVGTPLLGEVRPSVVKADITISLSRYREVVAQEWETLRPRDSLYLVYIRATQKSNQRYERGQNIKDHFGVEAVRGCEVLDIQPVEGAGNLRRLRVALDTSQYGSDQLGGIAESLYSSFNVLVRRKAKENNSKPILESIRDTMQHRITVPSWINDIFLGYGNPSSAHYSNISAPLETIDFRDTFIDEEHVIEAFSDKVSVVF